MGRGRQTKKTYLSIIGGKIVERVGETTDKEKAAQKCPAGAVTRNILDKKGVYQKTVFEVIDDFVEGIITNVHLKDGAYGWELHVTIRDMSDEFVLSIPANSAYFKHFAKKAQNIKNPAAPVRFAPYDFTANDGVRRRGITITQLGEPVTWFFTKEDSKGMPEFTKAPKNKAYDNWPEEIKDEYTIYMKKRDRWLRNYVAGIVAPMFSGNDLPEPTPTRTDEQTASAAAEAELEADISDDLPF